jgi:ABC-type multidrug transport system permease subunit
VNWTTVLAVAKTTFREFWRSPEAVFWTYGFPVLMSVVLGFAFRPQEPAKVPVAVLAAQEGATDSEPLRVLLAVDPRLDVQSLDEAAADAAIARGRVALVVRGTPAAPVVRSDPTRPEAEIGRLLVERALAGTVAPAAQPVQEIEDRPGSRYIDFLIPGLIGLNLLGAGLWGVGFNLVQWRTGNLLRRLLVTPMGRSEFLLGFLLSRLVLVLPESFAICGFGWLCFDVPFRGSLAAASVLMLAGSLAFSGLGILIASRSRTLEGVAGLMNLVLLPMWLLGGSFFSSERMTGILGWVADSLPMTWFNDAMRDLMLEPGGFAAAWPAIVGLVAVALASHGIALRIFRWV